MTSPRLRTGMVAGGSGITIGLMPRIAAKPGPEIEGGAGMGDGQHAMRLLEMTARPSRNDLARNAKLMGGGR